MSHNLQMKKIMLAAASAVLFSVSARAQARGDFGVGAALGNPLGPSAKYWLDERQAVQLGLGYSGDLAGWADWVWHDARLAPPIRSGRLLPYFGPGLRFEGKDDFEFGIRLVAGTAWRPEGMPVEVFAEIVPVLRLTPGANLGLDGAVGLRYYFRWALSPAAGASAGR